MPGTRRRWATSWLSWATVAVALGCSGPRDSAPLPPPIAALESETQPTAALPHGEPAPHVVVAFSVADRGELLPCACPDGVAGGWARKATLLGGLRTRLPGLVTVAGPESLIAGTTDPTRELGAAPGAAARAELLAAAGVQVLALGAADVAPLTAEQLVARAAASEIAWIATNLRRPDGTAPLSTVHVAVCGEQRIAILSLSEPGAAASGAAAPRAAALPGAEFSLEDPAVAVAQALGGLAVEPDAVIAFTDAPTAVLLDVAVRLRGVDFIVGITSRGGQRGVAIEDGARLIREQPGGTRVGLLDLVFSGPRGADFDDDPRVRELAAQRLIAVVDEARAGKRQGGEVGARRGELDRQLPVGVVEGHAWGFRDAALMADLPENEGIRHRLDSF